MGCDNSSAITWRYLWNETSTTLGQQPQARWLCETACGLAGDEFLQQLDELATQRMVAQLDAMIGRYRSGEPLAYVLGHWSFRTVELMIDRRVLIPRPETEVVAGRAIELAQSFMDHRCVVDLGTGSGAIGLSLAAELPMANTEVWLTDESVDALNVARANAAGLGRCGVNVRFAAGSWLSALPEQLRGAIHVIVSNPPYIGLGDDEVQESVVQWEPHAALFSGDDGLVDLRTIICEAPQWLADDGWLIVEIGYRQGTLVSELMKTAGFVDIRVGSDLSARQRYVEARHC